MEDALLILQELLRKCDTVSVSWDESKEKKLNVKDTNNYVSKENENINQTELLICKDSWILDVSQPSQRKDMYTNVITKFMASISDVQKIMENSNK